MRRPLTYPEHFAYTFLAALTVLAALAWLCNGAAT
ncbi:hypothetical protein FB470_001921 [Amycolatopsis thermophila]|uniref:Uncharacterized protein n=1 Tax=Amycolatopsis thermophila TaxID=206084 RepID=A0ABU0ERM9_9PSEU|nr:hypothetical protein [Amycolatopsis thermophila]